MPAPSSRSPFVLWIEWQGFYVEGSGLEVVLKDRVALDASPDLRRRGVVPGMELRQVRNLAPEARQREWDPEASAAKARDWLDRCVPFTGAIEPFGHHAAALDLSGHPRPGEIAPRVVASLRGLSIGSIRYGAGPATWIARLAADASDLESAVSDPAGFLAPFPVARLRPVEPMHRERLEFLGYRTLGAVASLPLSVLRGQFGDVGLAIQRAARGVVEERVRPLYPPDVMVESFPFLDPIDDLAALNAAWDRLARRLARRLEGKQAREMALVVEGEDGVRNRLSRRFTGPIFDGATVRNAIRLLDAGMAAPPGSVVGTTVSVGGLEPLRPRQQALIAARERPNPETAARALREAFGERAVTLAGRVELPRRERVLKEWRLATGWH